MAFPLKQERDLHRRKNQAKALLAPTFSTSRTLSGLFTTTPAALRFQQYFQESQPMAAGGNGELKFSALLNGLMLND